MQYLGRVQHPGELDDVADDEPAGDAAERAGSGREHEVVGDDQLVGRAVGELPA
jgi:hypothetical protein